MKILLMVPCFNEEDRLHFAAFKSGREENRTRNIDLTYLFVNDGSTDRTEEKLLEHAKTSGDLVYSVKENAGKANALQEAFSHHKDIAAQYDWIGYWDADLATPLNEIPRMMSFLDFYQDKEITSIWGSRISRLGSQIKRQMHRHYLGRIFVTIVSNVLGVKAYDSQCGAKLFRPASAELAFAEPFISRWIFDVEILLRLKEEKIIEFPLFYWEDVPGSKVKVFKEIFRVGKDLLKIRQKYLC